MEKASGDIKMDNKKIQNLLNYGIRLKDYSVEDNITGAMRALVIKDDQDSQVYTIVMLNGKIISFSKNL